MLSQGKLADYPRLARWFSDQGGQAPSADQPAHLLVYKTCEALAVSAESSVRRWIDGFRAFLNCSSAPLKDFLAAEAMVQASDAELPGLIGDFGEAAIRTDQATAFLTVMQQGADQTGLVVFRFLAAWTALNSGKLGLCVEECDKVDEPFGPIYTLQGQAFLELGQTEDAAQALEVSVKLAPTEILGWFQLAKARHILKNWEGAFQALRECRRLAPQSEEVAFYMALVALDSDRDVKLMQEAMQNIKPMLDRLIGIPMAICTIMRLAIGLMDKEQALRLVTDGEWTKLSSVKDVGQHLMPVLKDLNDAQWADVASQLLRRIAPAAS